jgi:iron(III) transport system ATP-binding protein
MRTILELVDVTKAYGDTVVVEDLSFSLEQGKIGCLLGPSGCGKTTILRAVAGFEDIEGGTIRIGSTIVSSKRKTVSPEKRRIGMVFQDYALFPHMKVFANIAFGLSKQSKKQQADTVEELLRVVGLEGAGDKYPHELSGGQQQRVALSRALAPRPDLLLMDEPFSNLDVTLRERLSVEVREILKSYGMTALLVTHNQLEAFSLADQVGVMDGGRLAQWDTAPNLYHRPRTEKVAKFVGEGVLLQGRIRSEGKVETGLGLLEGELSVACADRCRVKVLIRPEDVVHDDNSLFTATIIQKNFRGANILYTLQLPNGESVLSLVESHHNHQLGQEIGIANNIKDLVVYPE